MLCRIADKRRFGAPVSGGQTIHREASILKFQGQIVDKIAPR